MKFLLILVGNSFGYFSNQYCMASRPRSCGMFVWRFSTSKDAIIVSGLVDADNFDKKSVESLM